MYPFLPARWLTRDRFDNIANLQEYDGPVAAVICGQDEVIPNAHSRRLYESIRSRKRLWTFEEAGHNDWPASASEPWWDEMVEFLAR